MKASFKTVYNSVNKKLEAMVTRGKSPSGFLVATVWPSYLNYQRRRWETRNASSGSSQWPVPKYRKWKAENYSRWSNWKSVRNRMSETGMAARGTKDMIYTGQLFESMTLKNKKYGRRVIQGNTMTIGTTLPYASKVNETRDFVSFDKRFIDDLKMKYFRYMWTGK